MKRQRIALITSLIVATFSCQTEKNVILPFDVTSVSIDSSVLSKQHSNLKYILTYIDDEFCPWCWETYLRPGTTPIPPAGSTVVPGTTATAGNPTSSWTFENYAADQRFKSFADGLNAAEKAWLKAHPQRFLTAAANRFEAETITATYYNNPKQDNTNANAFKHIYWNKLNTLSWGPTPAKELADAHETAETNVIQKQMDLHNNEIGRSITGTIAGFPPPGRPADAYFLPKIFNAINSGQAWRLQDGESAGPIIPTNSEGRK